MQMIGLMMVFVILMITAYIAFMLLQRTNMNDLLKIILVTAALIYGMTAELPANEPKSAVTETQEAITKWYEETSTSISKDLTALGLTIQQLPENISLGVSNFWEEIKQFQKESWGETLKFEQEKQNWETIKGWFTPKPDETNKK
jgi:hypothetical protein